MIRNPNISPDTRANFQPNFLQRQYQPNYLPTPSQNLGTQESTSKEKFPSVAEGRNLQPTLSKQQNLSSPNLNIHELSQDLLRLKEQLKKLAERGEEIGANRIRAEQAQSARIKLEISQPNLLPNPSNIQFQNKRKEGNNSLIYYPSTASHPNNSFAFNNRTTENTLKIHEQLPPSKREKIDSFMSTKDQKNKNIPIFNGSKGDLTSQQLEKSQNQLRLESQITELKRKIESIEKQLKETKTSKDSLALELQSTKKAYQSLKDETRAKPHSSQNIPLEEFQKQQRKASIIIQKLQSQITQIKGTATRTSFDDALKTQLEENKLLKLRLQEKADEIQHLKDTIQQERKNYDTLKNEITIQEMKASTELRGKEQKYLIQLNDKANQLHTSKRALQTLDLKYRVAIKEIQQKDEFIMNYLVGRSKEIDHEEIKRILDQYVIVFPENRIMEDLLKQQKEIEELKKEVYRLSQS